MMRHTASHIRMAYGYGEITLLPSPAVYVVYESLILLEDNLITTTPHFNIDIPKHPFESNLHITTNP